MKVAIAGYGIEGEASFKYWHKLGADITIFDEKQPGLALPRGVKTVIGPKAFSQMNDFDLIVRTASLRPDKINTNSKIWSATNEFFDKCSLPIIGVTGTKGKGTTATLIFKILEQAGIKTWLVGNIGVPALSVLEEVNQYAKNSQKEGVVVFELSSFQLWDLKKSPHVAVVLMIEPDHMDVHVSMEEYIEAKANIGRFQTVSDIMIYHQNNKFSADIASKSSAKKLPYMVDQTAHIEDENIIIDGQDICSIKEVGLIGAHNLENICAAITAAWQYTNDVPAIKKAVTTFKGLPHRLEFVAEKNNVRFYDDSQATGVGSCLAALRSFSAPTTLILGGSDKGADMSTVINELDPVKHHVILIGQSSDSLASKLKERSFTKYINLGLETTMKRAVEEAYKYTPLGGVVLLSPAHASFGMFKNYQDRGDQFKTAVKNLV